ncbi:spore germination protein KC [Paenibacillus antibioticophila]|uniref:Spore germination protein KC n=1 Tax=Paenibacillus antibioticophila TaxID=1274374 RepID=A0A920CDJ6_9BACL|nr:Ger(x)C family spore germination protein [Paenibacillus antibioticophila]GIO35936.1 spore germination protein KC [Paenibacillus antibioticophila]
MLCTKQKVSHISFLLLLVILLAVLPGCWSKKELNELAIVMAMGIDYDDSDYEVSIQVMKSSELGKSEGGSSDGAPVITYRTSGKTIPDALQRMLSVAPRVPYLSHIRVLIFGESLARSGVSDALDFLSRNQQLRTDFFMLVSKGGKASEILDVVTSFENIPANSLYSSILLSEKKWAVTGRVTLQQFITQMERRGSNPVLPGVQVVGNKKEGESHENKKRVVPMTLLKHVGLAVFNRDRLVGWLGEPLSKSTNYALNEVHTTSGYIEGPEGGIVGFEVKRTKSDIKVKLGEDNVPEFTVKMTMETDLNAVQSTVDLQKSDMVEWINRKIEQKVDSYVTRDLRIIQEKYGTDVFGFGEALHRKYPKLWKKLRDHWDEQFKQCKITVKSKVAVRRIGSIVQPVKREMKEQ